MEMLSSLARLLCTLVARLESMLGPWLALAIRLWLAQAFLMAEIQSGMAAPVCPHPSAEGGGRGSSTMSPPRIPAWRSRRSVRCCWRLVCLAACAALAMLLQAALLATPGVAASIQLFWVALLLRICVAGPGRLSLDALVGPGCGVSHCAAAAAAQRVLGWTRRVLGPAYQLGVRSGLPPPRPGPALAALGVTHAMQPGLVWWLPNLPRGRRSRHGSSAGSGAAARVRRGRAGRRAWSCWRCCR